MENADNVEPHKRHRVRSADDEQDRDIADLREDLDKFQSECRKAVNDLSDKLAKHNERHYLLMGIIATVSFLAGLGLKVFQ